MNEYWLLFRSYCRKIFLMFTNTKYFRMLLLSGQTYYMTTWMTCWRILWSSHSTLLKWMKARVCTMNRLIWGET